VIAMISTISVVSMVSHDDFLTILLLRGYLLHSLNIVDPISDGIDDFNVLDVWDRVLGITETFYVVTKALIMLLPNGL
jgi:hypothetical protein